MDKVNLSGGKVESLEYKKRGGESGVISDLDGCVLALGAKGMKV